MYSCTEFSITGLDFNALAKFLFIFLLSLFTLSLCHTLFLPLFSPFYLLYLFGTSDLFRAQVPYYWQICIVSFFFWLIICACIFSLHSWVKCTSISYHQTNKNQQLPCYLFLLARSFCLYVSVIFCNCHGFRPYRTSVLVVRKFNVFFSICIFFYLYYTLAFICFQ